MGMRIRKKKPDPINKRGIIPPSIKEDCKACAASSNLIMGNILCHFREAIKHGTEVHVCYMEGQMPADVPAIEDKKGFKKFKHVLG